MNTAKIGLGLSGGGYRAAAYHLGTLEALHKIQIKEEGENKCSFLSCVNNFATVSGGSITGAYFLKYLAENHKKEESTTGEINFKNFDTEGFKQDFNKKLLRKNCEFRTIIMNPVLVIIPFLIGIGWWFLMTILPESFHQDTVFKIKPVYTFTISQIAFLGIFIGHLITKKKCNNKSIFRCKIVTIFCLASIFIFLFSLILILNENIEFEWLMFGFGAGVLIITVIVIAISEMVKCFKCSLIIIGCTLLFALITTSILCCFDAALIPFILDVCQIESKSLQLLPILLGCFLYSVYFVAYLLFPTGFSKRKRKFLERLFKKDERYFPFIPIRKNMTMNDLPRNVNAGILTIRIEEAQVCIFHRAKDDASAYPLADAVSKSCNFPPVFEPEEIKKKTYQDSSKTGGSIILLEQDDPITEKSSISLSDGGVLDNHGISVLCNEKLDLFSKVILLSDADPPYEMEPAGKGFINHLFELITKVLVKNVHILNYHKYFTHYLRDNCGVLKPVFISLKDDIDTIILNYRDRARAYEIMDYLNSLTGESDQETNNNKKSKGDEIDEQLKAYYESVKNKLPECSDDTSHNDEFESLRTDLENYCTPSSPGENKTEEEDNSYRKKIFGMVFASFNENRFTRLLRCMRKIHCEENGAGSVKDTLARDRFMEYDLAFLTDNSELFEKIGFPCKDKYYLRPGDKDKEVFKEIQSIPTRLVPIKKATQKNLEKHARTLTEFLVKFWIVKKKEEGEDSYTFRKDIFILQLSLEEYCKISGQYGENYERLPTGVIQLKDDVKNDTSEEGEALKKEIWKVLYADGDGKTR